MRRLCFPLLAQWHQAFHSLPVAAALSRRPGLEVHVAPATPALADQAERLLRRLGACGIRIAPIWSADPAPPKLALLALLAPRVRSFDAVVVPERTSLLLRRMGVRRPLFVHTDHGAGDLAVGYEPRIREFDGVLLAGRKQEARMRRAGLIRPGAYAIVGYPKFEAVAALDRPATPLFETRRPTVLYNPHFRRGLTSWRRFGPPVLSAFANQERYNLIFAPHVRLAAEHGPELRRLLAPYRARPNIHIDLGGERCCDMTYVDHCDVYLGDVSSQVYEFIRRPRPCLFLDAHGVSDAIDENYAHWAFGPVVRDPELLLDELDRAVRVHGIYRPVQAAAFRRTFDLQVRSCSERAADAVVSLLLTGRMSAEPALAAA